jgi:import inner membrane translocase subunit TIM50
MDCFPKITLKPINRQISINRLTFSDKNGLFLRKLSYNRFILCLSNGENKSSLIKSYSTANQKIEDLNQSSQQTNTDSEQMEKEKQKLRQQKITKYTLLVMLCMFSGSAVYALCEWGKPSVDENGNAIEDRFSQLPIALQYIYRAWDTFTHYEQVLREPTRELLLPPPLQPPYFQPPYTLVLEMTGVLVHPEWTYRTGWRFKKRPFVDYFLQQCATSTSFEIVIYTYEQGFTAFPLIDSLDPNGFVMYRLFRDSTRYEDGVHLKDLNCLNRDLSKVIHIDWNKNACRLNPNNCLTLKKWDGDSNDRTLYDLAQFLRAIANENIEDIRDVLQHYSQFDDPLEAFKENQRKLAEREKELQLKKSPTVSNPFLKPWKIK